MNKNAFISTINDFARFKIEIYFEHCEPRYLFVKECIGIKPNRFIKIKTLT